MLQHFVIEPRGWYLSLSSFSQVDPYLKLVEDVRLQAVCLKSDMDSIAYGSKEDDVAASKSLLEIELDDLHLKETVISHFMMKFEKLSEVIYQFLDY